MSSVEKQPKSDGVGGREVLDDGQEEVFSKTAVDKGLIKDPKAMDPKDVRQGDDGR